jgi:hypothetical protein
MSVNDLSWKAMLVGCLVIAASWPLFLLLPTSIEIFVEHVFLGEPWTDPLHAVLVVFIIVFADSAYAFAVSDPNPFEIARILAIGGLAALPGSRIAIRTQGAKSPVDDAPD